MNLWNIRISELYPGDEEDPYHPHPQHGRRSSSRLLQTCTGKRWLQVPRSWATAAAHVAQLGLKYVHNDTCYPALLVIGQFLDALNSGKYDLEHTRPAHHPDGRRLPCFQLHPPAAQGAGQGRLPGHIPVASLNFSGLEKDSGFQMTLPLARTRAGLHLLWRYAHAPCATRPPPMRTKRASADNAGGQVGGAFGP